MNTTGQFFTRYLPFFFFSVPGTEGECVSITSPGPQQYLSRGHGSHHNHEAPQPSSSPHREEMIGCFTRSSSTANIQGGNAKNHLGSFA